MSLQIINYAWNYADAVCLFQYKFYNTVELYPRNDNMQILRNTVKDKKGYPLGPHY
jgi:hypothetical protein